MDVPGSWVEGWPMPETVREAGESWQVLLFPPFSLPLQQRLKPYWLYWELGALHFSTCSSIT